MPSVSGWALQPTTWSEFGPRVRVPFLCLGVGPSFATIVDQVCADTRAIGFYALGVGLGFATHRPSSSTRSRKSFLCARCRARLCNAVGFSRLPQKVSMPSVSGWALQRRLLIPMVKAASEEFLCPRCRAGLATQGVPAAIRQVSRFLCPRCRAGLATDAPEGVCDLQFCRLLRQPSRRGGTRRPHLRTSRAASR
jgi:hypothetical protein